MFTASLVALAASSLPVVHDVATPRSAGAMVATADDEPNDVVAQPLTQTRATGVDEAVITINVVEGGAPAANAPITISRAGANRASSTTYITDGVGEYEYRYTGQYAGLDVVNVASTEGRLFAVTVAWVPPTGTLSYPSEDCTAGTIVRGFIGNSHVNVRVQPNPSNANELWVCAAAQVSNAHVGGKVIIATNPGAVPPVVAVDDTQAQAEACRPIGRTVVSGDVGEDEFFVDVAPNPNGRLGAWVCIRFGDVWLRIRATSETIATVGFVPDLASTMVYDDANVPGPWSGTCQDAGGLRWVNLVLAGGTRVSLYTWNQDDGEGAPKRHVCVAFGGAGGRLTVDDDEHPTLALPATFAPSCEFKVGVDEPVAVNVWIPEPGGETFPLSVCVQVGGTIQRVTVHAADDQLVQFRSDSDPA